VLLRANDVFGRYAYPFEVLSTETASGTLTITALYRELASGVSYEGAIERAFNDIAENALISELIYDQQSTALAGTYAREQDWFFFVASNTATSMRATFASSSTLATDEGALDPAVAAGAADGVAFAALDGGAARELPGMLAFSRDGVVRTATVFDARIAPFTNFTAYTSTVEQYDRVRLARNSQGELLLAYRAVQSGQAKLMLRENVTGAPGDFVELPAMTRPRVAAGIEIIAVPNATGGEEFVIAYEEEDLLGRTDVRLLRVSEYGTSPGYAPFALDMAQSRRLEDVGLVQRDDEVRIALLVSRVGVGAELSYTEVPLAALSLPDTNRGRYGGVVLDNASVETRGRLGCKRHVMRTCPIVWLGENASVLFLRR
jgi:hypothetical protein